MKLLQLGVITIMGIALLLMGCASSATPEEVEFAKCLSKNEATFFGAYWCSHCKDQKSEFKDAFNEINYVECSLPGGQGQTAVCEQAGITGYPTWEFADGERISGKVSWEELSLKTGCPLPN